MKSFDIACLSPRFQSAKKVVTVPSGDRSDSPPAPDGNSSVKKSTNTKTIILGGLRPSQRRLVMNHFLQVSFPGHWFQNCRSTETWKRRPTKSTVIVNGQNRPCITLA